MSATTSTKINGTAVAGGGGVGGGTLLVAILDSVGVHLSNAASAAIAGAVMLAIAFVWKHGVRGAFRTVLDGSEAPAEPPCAHDPDPAPAVVSEPTEVPRRTRASPRASGNVKT